MMNRGSTQTLWNQSNERMIMFPQQMVILEKISNNKKNSALDIIPVFDIKKKKKAIKPSGPGALVHPKLFKES
jgi:hypothetical protein